ncbi:MAG: iron-containing alcohol dehydrogenase [Eubacteriales bacterium]
MKNFSYYNPTRVYFGIGEFSNLGTYAQKLGKNALLVKMDGYLETSGVYARAKKLMEDAGMTVYELSGVTANPKLTKIDEGIRLCKEVGIDVVIPVGGGSCIDSAKAIAYGALDDGDIWDFFELKRVAAASLPIGAVSTIAATGSEMNVNCVVTNDRDSDMTKWRKWSTHFEHSFPKFAIIDPEMQKTLPRYVTACGMADIISHIMEPYFDSEVNTPIQDALGEGIIKTVIASEGILTDKDNLVYRANLSWGATLAINGWADVGRAGKAWDAHTIEHDVGAMTDCAHGAGLAVLQPSWLRHLNRQNSTKFARFARNVFGIEQGSMSDYELGEKGIDALKEKFNSWGMPATLTDLKLTKEMLPVIARKITQNPEGLSLVYEDVLSVLENCFE